MAAPSPQRVLITGIAGELAGQLAARLETDDRVEYVAGLDLREPARALRRTEYIRADLRNPLVAKVVDSTRIDTVVHLDLTAGPAGAGRRMRTKDVNVIGTMQLLAAAQRAPRLRRLVIRSTTAVYGSAYADPALFGEDAAAGAPERAGYAKDAVEVEGYARAFGRRRPDVDLTVLRFANVVGPHVDGPIARYLSLPVVPTVLGYDPRLQLCHESDAVELLQRACVEHHPGIYNVAGPGIVYLSQAIRIAGRPSMPVPLPLVEGTAALVRRAGRVDFTPEQLRYLLYGRVGDIDRMRAEFGYEPRFRTRDALVDFLERRGVAPLVDRATARRCERALYDALSSRRGRVPPGLARAPQEPS